LGLSSLFWAARIPIKVKETQIALLSQSLGEMVINPWKRAIKLLIARPDFRRFQWGFTWCGGGVMLTYAVMPHYFVRELKVSYGELALAFAFYKGMGYALSSQSWVKHLNRQKIYHSSRDIFLVVSMFPILLLLARWQINYLYLAFFVYGLGLAGNHLIWHMSGPIFSLKQDSSAYSSVNILMVGIRGMIFPLLGAYLVPYLGTGGVLGISVGMCLIGAILMHWARGEPICSAIDS
jgi:hypothetical protein